jgi:lysosomal acid lipase/cholesteryl ester hydrolase
MIGSCCCCSRTLTALHSVGACLNSPAESLPYILADHGYEVWLGNNRGNGVSMGHIQYTPNDPQFWDFTWSDMASYDLPAQVSHVLGATNQSKLSYIGHSEGTIQAFAALIEQPALADQLHLYVALAPVAYVGTYRTSSRTCLYARSSPVTK